MSYTTFCSLLLATASTALAQPYGFLTPVPSNSFLRAIAVQSGQQLRSYPLPQQGLVTGLAVNSAGTLLYTVSNLTSGAEVAVSSVSSHLVVAAIPLTFTPYSMLLSPDNTKLYVAGTTNFTAAYICVIDAIANTVITTFTLNVTPDPSATFPMAITPDSSVLYLAAGGLIRLNTVGLTTLVFPSPSSFSQGIAITPDGSQLWFSLNNTIQVRNAKTLVSIATISATGSPFGGNGLFITPDGTEAILANNGLRAFSTASFQLTSSISTPPFGQLGYITAGPDSGSFLVTNTAESLVLRVSNALTLLGTYIQSGSATTTVSLPGGQEILASNGDVNAVGTVNSSSGSLGPSIPVGCQAGTPGINKARTHLYVPDRCSQDITIVSLSPTAPGERLLHGPIFATKALVSPDESRIYAADLSGIKYAEAGTIEILDVATGAVINTITGGLTVDIALSADGSRLYVDDNGSSGSGFDCPIGGICVFDTSTFSLLAQIPNVFGPLALSQDGNSLYAGPGGDTLALIDTSTFAVSQITLPTSLTSLGAVAVSPVGNVAMIVGNGSAGGVGFLLDTVANQVTDSFPVPVADLRSAAFAPNGNTMWFLAGTSSSIELVEESFPAGQVITQTAAQGTWITFGPAF